MLSAYEKKRLENIEANKQILRELGLERPPMFSSAAIYKKNINKTKPKKRKVENTNENKDTSNKRIKNRSSLDSDDDSTSRDQKEYSVVRRSSRLAKLPVKSFEEVDEIVERKRNSKKYPEWKKYRPNPKQFGEIPNVGVGAWWATRMECSHQGVHAPTVAGIAFDESEGAYSVALSGGYEDDVDWGEAFTYTGSGGRDLKGTKKNPKNLRVGPQTKDQTLANGNLALKISCETSNPYELLGYKLGNEFAPKEGYRYDGLYIVEKWWEETGLAGFRVFKFAFKRMAGQLPLGTCEKSWSDGEEDDDYNEENEE